MSDKTKNQLVRERAYEIWQSEGRPLGKEWEHWLRAEMDLSNAKDTAAKEAAQVVKKSRARKAPAKKTTTKAAPAKKASAKKAPAKAAPAKKTAAKAASAKRAPRTTARKPAAGAKAKT